jgi:hypothetical protein
VLGTSDELQVDILLRAACGLECAGEAPRRLRLAHLVRVRVGAGVRVRGNTPPAAGAHIVSTAVRDGDLVLMLHLIRVRVGVRARARARAKARARARVRVRSG